MNLQALAKAELHVHLDGTLTPALVKKLAAEAYPLVTLDPTIFSWDQKNFVWRDFSDFHRVFEEAFAVIRSRADYALITYLYLTQLAQQNCLYVEIIVSPFHAEQNGLSYADMLDGIATAIDRARQEFGIECRLLMVILRHYGPAAAQKYMRQIIDHPHPYVVGVNLVGDIKQYEIKAFAQVFGLARQHGLRVSCHAGEIDGGPQEIWQALDYLGAERISHGVTCLQDPRLVAYLIDNAITLEVCPSSNVLLGMYADYDQHPLRALQQAGVLLTLNTDDPGFFNTSLTQEYQLAIDHAGFSLNDLLATTQQAIQAAFIPAALKQALLNQVATNIPRPRALPFGHDMAS